jgi:hypothetical protein
MDRLRLNLRDSHLQGDLCGRDINCVNGRHGALDCRPHRRSRAGAACAAAAAETFSDTIRWHSALAEAPPADMRAKRIAMTR